METGVIYSIHMAPLVEIFVNSAVQSYIAIFRWPRWNSYPLKLSHVPISTFLHVHSCYGYVMLPHYIFHTHSPCRLLVPYFYGVRNNKTILLSHETKDWTSLIFICQRSERLLWWLLLHQSRSLLRASHDRKATIFTILVHGRLKLCTHLKHACFWKRFSNMLLRNNFLSAYSIM